LKNFPPQNLFRIALIGESCIDEYRYGICERICPEGPVPVFSYQKMEKKEGMSSNVYSNLISMGIKVDHFTNDPNLIIRRRFFDDKSKHLLLREDVGESIPVFDFNIDDEYDAIMISDYDKGAISEDFISKIISNFDGPIFVDSKKKDLSIFNKCILKINNFEKEVLKKLPLQYELIVTNGSDKISWRDKEFEVPQVEIFDVTGAGDVFFSALVFFYLLNKDLEKSIVPAARLASISVTHTGTYTVTKEDLGSVI